MFLNYLHCMLNNRRVRVIPPPPCPEDTAIQMCFKQHMIFQKIEICRSDVYWFWTAVRTLIYIGLGENFLSFKLKSMNSIADSWLSTYAWNTNLIRGSYPTWALGVQDFQTNPNLAGAENYQLEEMVVGIPTWTTIINRSLYTLPSETDTDGQIHAVLMLQGALNEPEICPMSTWCFSEFVQICTAAISIYRSQVFYINGAGKENLP